MTVEANVFEDPSGIRREGWLRRLAKIDLVREHGIVPDGYGVAWELPATHEAVIAPMPWHALLGWCYRRYWDWRMGRRKQDALSAAYDAGWKDRELRELRVTIQDHERRIEQAHAEGQRIGRRRLLDELQQMADSGAWRRNEDQ